MHQTVEKQNNSLRFLIATLSLTAALFALADEPSSRDPRYSSCEAWNVAITRTDIVSEEATAPAFSHDCSRLAYIGTNGIVVKFLDHSEPDVIYPVAGLVAFAWAPNDNRFFCVLTGERLQVVETQTKKIIDLPIKSLLTEIDAHLVVLWESENAVYMGAGRGGQAIVNLDTLQTWIDAHLSPPEQASKHPNLSFVTQDQACLFAKSKKKDYMKCIQIGGSYTWSANAKYIAKLEERKLSLLSPGQSKSSETEFLVGDFVGASGHNWDTILPGLKSGIDASVYRGVTNPLNGKITGPVGEPKLEATVRLKGNEVYAFITVERFEPAEINDVISDFCHGRFPTAGIKSIWGVLKSSTEQLPKDEKQASGAQSRQISNASAEIQASPIQSSPVDGVWNWTNPGRGTAPGRRYILTLTSSGKSLSGTLASVTLDQSGHRTEQNILNGNVEGRRLSFSLKLNMADGTWTSTYAGTVQGDAIEGDISTIVEAKGKTTPLAPRNWVARRQAP